MAPPPRTNSDKYKKPYNRGQTQKHQPMKKKKRASVKSQLRSAKRLLAKTTDKTVICTTKARIAELEGKLSQNEQNQKEKKYAIKYHRVKFFERRKLMRKEKKCLRELNSSDISEEKKQKLQFELKQIREDFDYIEFYPKDEKYIGLFMDRGKDDEAFAKSREIIKKKQQEIRERIPMLKEEALKQDSGNDKVQNKSLTPLPGYENYKNNEKELLEQEISQKDNTTATTTTRRIDRMEELSSEEKYDRKNSESDSSSSNSVSTVSDTDSSESEDEVDSNNIGNKKPSHDEPVTVGNSSGSGSDAEESEDDFFVDNDEDNENDAVDIFANAAQDQEYVGAVRGDKSKGWLTQNGKRGKRQRR